MAYLMVGSAATIRYGAGSIDLAVDRGVAFELTAGFVILPSCWGTLKSTRMRTRLPWSSRSVIESLLESDMVDENQGGRRTGPLIKRITATATSRMGDHNDRLILHSLLTNTMPEDDTSPNTLGLAFDQLKIDETKVEASTAAEEPEQPVPPADTGEPRTEKKKPYVNHERVKTGGAQRVRHHTCLI